MHARAGHVDAGPRPIGGASRFWFVGLNGGACGVLQLSEGPSGSGAAGAGPHPRTVPRMDVMIGVIVLCVVIGVPGTLIWWRIADRWADDEHKRFKARPRDRAGSAPAEPTVVEFGDERRG